jgi:hypothetical protein
LPDRINESCFADQEKNQTIMKHFKIVPFSKEYAASIRDTMKDDFGNTVNEQLSSGFGPCRVSLEPFVPGKDIRLVFSHSPFTIQNAFNQPGPVFINKQIVEPYQNIYQFPPLIKADPVNFPLSLIGYSKDQKMIFAKLVGTEDVDQLIPKIFTAEPNVQYLHARNAEACCFICKIERV